MPQCLLSVVRGLSNSLAMITFLLTAQSCVEGKEGGPKQDDVKVMDSFFSFFFFSCSLQPKISFTAICAMQYYYMTGRRLSKMVWMLLPWHKVKSLQLNWMLNTYTSGWFVLNNINMCKIYNILMRLKFDFKRERKKTPNNLEMKVFLQS